MNLLALIGGTLLAVSVVFVFGWFVYHVIVEAFLFKTTVKKHVRVCKICGSVHVQKHDGYQKFWVIQHYGDNYQKCKCQNYIVNKRLVSQKR